MTGTDAPVSGKAQVSPLRRRESQGLDLGRITSGLQDIFTRTVRDLLQQFFVVVDDELFKRSDKWDGNAHQSLYFNEMRQFRMESSTLQTSFEQRIQEDFEKFWSDSIANRDAASVLAQDKAEFSLLENEALEEEIAVSTMSQKGNKLFQDQIKALSLRLGSLLRIDEPPPGEIPFSPDALCRAFSHAIKPLASDLVVKLLIFKLFDRVVVSSLGSLYEALNAFLIKEGVLPNLPKAVQRNGISAPGLADIPSPGPGPGDGSELGQGAFMEVFQGMQRLLEGWRAQMGLMPVVPDGAANRGPAFEPPEVLKALNVLQAPETGLVVGSPPTEGLKVYVASQLAQSHPGEPRPLGRQEEDIIDMVALIFDFILDDRNLPDAVKGLIARLQIPVIKVAIIEKSFFARKNHPVRLLLNSLAQAGVGLDPGEDITETPTYRKIETVITRILDEFDQNVSLFSDLLDEFLAFLERENHRSRVAEERTRQVTQSREQLHTAKRKIAYEIATRLEGKAVPAAVRSFLYNTWKDVLVLAYLRRDKQPREWENALIVMDKLLWTVTPVAVAQERKAIIQMIPRLLKAIRVGLESISMDPQSVASTIKELEHCHVSRLSHQEPRYPGSEAETESAQDEEATRPVEIRDPELAKAIQDIKAGLPEVHNLTAKDLAAIPETPPALPADAEMAEHWSKVNALQLGDWMEFDEGRKQVRGKLSWKSQVSSNYVFVNRKGAKILDIGLEQLAGRVADGSARLIEGADVPLMDRAFGALMSKLNGPVPRSG